LRKASASFIPRFGTEPRLGEKARLSWVRFNSRTLSFGPTPG
jgi:hypothetical protein